MSDTTCILGLAAGYHLGDVRPFLLSLRETGYAGRCVLFVSATTRQTDEMAALGAEIVPFERPVEMADISYNAYRYFLYLDFLKQADGAFEHVLFTDVRDVLFQADPFTYPWHNGLNCTLEDRRMTLGACPHNAHWIRGHQGEAALAEVADKPISCSGTTVGTHAALVEYLEALTQRLVPFGGGERMGGYDQGVHNVMVHTGAVDAVFHDNTGPILTLGYTKGEPEQDDAGFVLNESGDRAHIVHQYDRKPKLFASIRTRFA